MLRRKLASTALCALAALALTTGTSVAATAEPARAEAKTINYQTAQPGNLAAQIDESVAIWNKVLKNVQFAKGSGGISVSVYDGTGPAPGTASCVGCTSGVIKIYPRKAEEYKAGIVRVIVHEFGHILSLNHPSDIGNCDKVMAGGACDNPQPSADEIAAVDRFWNRPVLPAPGAPADDSAIFGTPAR
ncbi:hypothetical protein GCM10010123_42570 [Pilimelia anulata]|uniref:Extracellular small neutral protease n=1 Tax=Pilimelia anulata TaxID=53371 RepID=A0A8J3FD37_9ACTN|nr:snapalysin family zinc-dependent metalloprotease [Pilimelia anulata]GGK08099.1 hypothetical protein GCM10010123_42570 [Pilimelia anulata]